MSEPEPWKSLRVIDGQKYVLLSEVGEATIKRIAATMKAEGGTRELKAALSKAHRYIRALQSLVDTDFTPQNLQNEVSAACKEWQEAERLLG